jgi:hypothetical protein
MPSPTAGHSPSWQSTLVALALIALLGGIFVVVFEKDGTDEALKVWGGLGTLVGVLVGAVPTYFFSRQATAVAQEETKRVHETATKEVDRWRDALEQSQDTASKALKARGEDEVRTRRAEAKFDALVPYVSPQRMKEVREARPELFPNAQ